MKSNLKVILVYVLIIAFILIAASALFGRTPAEEVTYSDIVALFRENLYEKVWGDEYLADSRTLDLHVQRLRRKMGWEENLVAVYKIGYRLEI